MEGVTGSAIMRNDGSVVASRLPGGIDPKELSKRAIKMMESARQYSEKAGGSAPSYAFAGGSEGFVAVAQGERFLLVCIFGAESDADSVESKIRKAAVNLRELA